MRRFLMALALACLLALAGCGRGPKADIAKKAEGLKTSEDIQRVLGKPDKHDTATVGPIKTETLVYKCSDGQVVISITPMGVAVVTSEKKE